MIFQLDSRPSPCSTAITIVSATLLGIGAVMVFSASASLTSPPITENVLRSPSVRQVLFTCGGLVTLLLVGLCPHESWRIRRATMFQPSVLLLVVTVLLLVVVLIFGEERHGAKRWLSLGPATGGLSFQPSELAKLAMVVFLSAYCAHRGVVIKHFWSGLLPALLVLGLVVALVGKEDFGTSVLVMVVGGGILLAAGARIWHLGLVSLPAVAGLAYLVFSRAYRMQRILSFLDPYADPQDTGYHQVQSLITIASGGWWGRGIGAGVQKYGYLPEGRSDFIFAVICEELGIIGGAAVIGLFVVLLWHGRKAMLAAASDFGRLLALGATLTIGLQAALNVAVVTVSLPTKGIGLPLVSAGGTGVILLSALVGMLVNVARFRRAPSAADEPTACLPEVVPPVGLGAGEPAAEQPIPGPA